MGLLGLHTCQRAGSTLGPHGFLKAEAEDSSPSWGGSWKEHCLGDSPAMLTPTHMALELPMHPEL